MSCDWKAELGEVFEEARALIFHAAPLELERADAAQGYLTLATLRTNWLVRRDRRQAELYRLTILAAPLESAQMEMIASVRLGAQRFKVTICERNPMGWWELYLEPTGDNR